MAKSSPNPSPRKEDLIVSTCPRTMMELPRGSFFSAARTIP